MPQIDAVDVNVRFEVNSYARNSIRSAIEGLFDTAATAPRFVQALKSVAFTIGAGERVGVIGANGAGKTTLLKVIAGIYPPQTGQIQVRGHVSPIFEFATGFEMDDTGWENIRTRALLLGMPWFEITEKIEEIASFSELGEFLDMPVRHYSSGMLLRLAFATSTAVDPEILLLDEVMAAGDEAFIASARSRMNDIMQRANIVIFATHNLAALPRFCARALWLDHGVLMMDGPSPRVIDAYRSSVNQSIPELNQGR